jgi:hypothetical protein
MRIRHNVTFFPERGGSESYKQPLGKCWKRYTSTTFEQPSYKVDSALGTPVPWGGHLGRCHGLRIIHPANKQNNNNNTITTIMKNPPVTRKRRVNTILNHPVLKASELVSASGLGAGRRSGVGQAILSDIDRVTDGALRKAINVMSGDTIFKNKSKKALRKEQSRFGDGTKAGTGIKGKVNIRKPRKQSYGMSATQIAAPASLGISTLKTPAAQTRTSNGVRVRNRELVIATINGSSAFTVAAQIPINPGLSGTFPWLNLQAQQYESYKIHSLKAIYIPVTNSTVSGSIMIIPDYDASDMEPLTEIAAANNIGAMESVVWNSMEMKLNPKEMMVPGPKKYVRGTMVGGDLKTFDAGLIYVCTNNCSITTIIGKLWLEYDIEFFSPQTASANVQNYPKYHTEYYINGNQSITKNILTTVNFINPIYDPLRTSVTAGLVTPPAGCYLVEFTITAYDSTPETNLLTVTNTGTSTLLTPGGFTCSYGTGATSNTTTAAGCFLVYVTPGQTLGLNITLTGATGPLVITNQSRMIISAA